MHFRGFRGLGDVETRVAKICKPIRWSFSTPDKNKIDVEGRIEDDSGEMDIVVEGALTVSPRKKIAQVSFIRSHGYPRCGYGTKLYEKFLEVACAKGLKLSSDTTRSEASEGFWQKQVRKGRARCTSYKKPARRIDQRFDSMGHWSCERFEMIERCPADRSLSGLKRRRRR